MCVKLHTLLYKTALSVAGVGNRRRRCSSFFESNGLPNSSSTKLLLNKSALRILGLKSPQIRPFSNFSMEVDIGLFLLVAPPPLREGFLIVGLDPGSPRSCALDVVPQPANFVPSVEDGAACAIRVDQ